jgi:hypothetical protein
MVQGRSPSSREHILNFPGITEGAGENNLERDTADSSLPV